MRHLPPEHLLRKRIKKRPGLYRTDLTLRVFSPPRPFLDVMMMIIIIMMIMIMIMMIIILMIIPS
jgi:hypothetical protein